MHEEINNTKIVGSPDLTYEVQQFFHQFVQLQVRNKEFLAVVQFRIKPCVISSMF